MKDSAPRPAALLQDLPQTHHATTAHRLDRPANYLDIPVIITILSGNHLLLCLHQGETSQHFFFFLFFFPFGFRTAPKASSVPVALATQRPASETSDNRRRAIALLLSATPPGENFRTLRFRAGRRRFNGACLQKPRPIPPRLTIGGGNTQCQKKLGDGKRRSDSNRRHSERHHQNPKKKRKDSM